ncbi:hypothetical protein ScPMuIL_001201 [Solemya velum]
MHGRLKVKSTEEQKEAKRIEQEKKLKLYTAATEEAFRKRKDGEYDDEALKVSGEILYRNSDFSTMWNFRKEIFLHMNDNKNEDELQELFDSELDFLEACLKYNPKSYGTWHHRCFVLDTMPRPDWEKELKLCNLFLQYDERNFHCWDYRRFIVKRSQVTPEAELEFTTNKISSNFSNYSSWHYRSKLLPFIHPDPSSPAGVKEDILLQEYEMVQNAFFTDPDDQSAWFYYRWLLGRGKKTVGINCVCCDKIHSKIIVSTTEPVLVPDTVELKVEVDGSHMPMTWRTASNNIGYSNLWISDIPEDFKISGSCTLTLTLGGSSTSCSCELLLQDDSTEECYFHKDTPAIWFRSELSAAATTTLKRELDSVKELHEMEPENKWVLLTSISLMKSLDSHSYEDTIMDELKTLETIDSHRTSYYRDLRSKYLTENILERTDLSKRCLRLRDVGLTVFYHAKLLPLLVELDLSNNRLTSLRDVRHIYCLQRLCVDDNQISKLQGLESIVHLKEISIRNNEIKREEEFQFLRKCPLVVVNIAGNPVCDSVNVNSVLRNILTGLKKIDDIKIS